MHQKKVLLFNVGFMKEGQIFKLCKMQNIEVVKIRQEDYGECLGYLAGINGIKKNGTGKQGVHLSGEMMVFAGISSEELDIFLQKYNEMGIEKIPLKAMLTPFNVRWTGEMLYQELVKEHNAMSGNVY